MLGGAIYAAAASPGWESYEILGDGGVEPFLKQYLSVHPELSVTSDGRVG